jgi:glyoxylase-like metal-dependent hydrolase (beta-lactamase superfamily II)
VIGPGLPAGVQVFERGWLSANNILFLSGDTAALIDSGYCTHSAQTVALVSQALEGRELDLLLNTHLHSDHCGGNHALQNRYPGLVTQIPPGQAAFVSDWDPLVLGYVSTGQLCPSFTFTDVLEAGKEIALGGQTWEIHAATGHDPHSVIFFEPQTRTLVSADAMWENGFGVVFPELEGTDAFEEVSDTLDLIEHLNPRIVIPGHGKVFGYSAEAMTRARSRLDSFVRHPLKHANHAVKVLLKFKLLDAQRLSSAELMAWAGQVPYLALVQRKFFPELPLEMLITLTCGELIKAGAAQREGDVLLNN